MLNEFSEELYSSSSVASFFCVGISCINWYLPLDNGIAGTIQWND